MRNTTSQSHKVEDPPIWSVSISKGKSLCKAWNLVLSSNLWGEIRQLLPYRQRIFRMNCCNLCIRIQCLLSCIDILMRTRRDDNREIWTLPWCLKIRMKPMSGLIAAHHRHDGRPGPCVQQHRLFPHESKPAAPGTAIIRVLGTADVTNKVHSN